MGDFTLGCLLGQYDKAQSFDVASVALTAGTNLNSWDLIANQGSFYFDAEPTRVHSSSQALRVSVFSTGGSVTAFRHIYGHGDDAHARWFPDVTTHQLQVRLWASPNLSADSGDLIVRLLAQDLQVVEQIPIPHRTTGLEPIVFAATHTYSDGANTPWLDFVRSFPGDAATTVYIDDVLVQIDPITLNPEYGFVEQARLNESRHRTQGGKLYNYVWSKHFAYRVPLRYITDSHAATINWWWENRFNLAFTLNTSDSESIHVCRIVNDRQPIGKRIKPYKDLWEGTIELESIDQGSLVF